MTQRGPRVEGYDYLYQRGRSFEVRVQVPQPLRAVVGKGELKKSLGSNFAMARKRHPGVLSAFLNQIDAARNAAGVIVDSPDHPRNQPTSEDVEIACYAHFQRMAKNMRGKVAQPVGNDPQSLENRAEGFKLMIENQVSAYANDAWAIMGLDAEWLCEQQGWTIAPDSGLFEHLCRTMLRARLQCYRNEVRRLEGKMSADPDADPLFGSQPPLPNKAGATLGFLIDGYTADRAEGWSASTERNYVIINRVLEEICGRDTPVSNIDRDFCRNVRSLLLRLPANYQKLPATKGRPIAEVIEIAESLGLQRISPATVNGHLTKLGAIIRFGRDEGLILGNPMANVEVNDPIHASEKRDPFSISHLNAIFSSPPWCYGFPKADQPSRYWAPMAALFTGARLTDICGQRVDEMIEEDGVRLFNFVHRPGERHIKAGRSRKVPVHPNLLGMGFWIFVEQARLSGRVQLFPDVARDGVGKWGDNTSKWFSRQIRNLDLKGRCLSFHSFRHSFEDALRRAELHDTPIGNALTGRWSAGSSKNYGNKYPVGQLRDAIAKVHYPGLVLPAVSVATEAP